MSEVYSDNNIRTGELTARVLSHFGCTGENYSNGKYVGMTQLRTDAGWDVTTADVVIMGAWPSTGHKVQGFEVKISRSDWLNEVKKPHKNSAIKKYCDQFWLVIADEKMVKEGELPDDWGMMVPNAGGLKIVKKAPMLIPEALSNGFVAMMLRSNQSPSVPMDVYHDSLKDSERKWSSKFKEEYAGLVSYVKQLNKELGIKLEYKDYSNPKEWRAEIGNWQLRREVANGSHQLTPQELAAAVKIVLSGNLDHLKWQLQSASSAAEDILRITKDFKGDEK